jgi:hypothetical protein
MTTFNGTEIVDGEICTAPPVPGVQMRSIPAQRSNDTRREHLGNPLNIRLIGTCTNVHLHCVRLHPITVWQCCQEKSPGGGMRSILAKQLEHLLAML